jgi:hypothetical protein
MADPQSRYPPPSGLPTGTLDERDIFARLTAAKPRSDVFDRFRQGKLRMLRTSPLIVVPQPKVAEAELTGSMPAALASGATSLAGGVAYGMFYNTAFRTGYGTGVSISWEIICLDPPGGNVTDSLYITATNGSSKGVEAFLAYQGQNNTSFNAYDWSRPDPKQINVALSSVAEYIGTETINGVEYPVLPVMNSTYEDSPGQWVNELSLMNIATGEWVSVYKSPNAYAATLQDQQTGFVGSWGPIVEVFQVSYSGTKPMGAINTQIRIRDASGNWGAWENLTPAASYADGRGNGFTPFLVTPNSTWTVQS